jgi:recombination protein U
VTKKKSALQVSVDKSKASKSGAKGEKIVAEYHAAARAAGTCVMHHVPTPSRLIPRNGGWMRILDKPSTVDSVGFMLDGTGRVVAEEIKTCTAKPRFDMSEVELHQAAYLDSVEEAGGVAVLTIVFGANRDVCPIDWSEAKKELSRTGKRSLTGDFILQHRITPLRYLSCFRAPSVIGAQIIPVAPSPADPDRRMTKGGTAELRTVSGMLLQTDGSIRLEKTYYMEDT